ELTSSRLLSFDIFGTLIDWELGVFNAILTTPHFSSLSPSHPMREIKTLLPAYFTAESAIQAANPSLLYSAVVAGSFSQLVRDYNLSVPGTPETEQEALLDSTAKGVGESIGTWPAFPDTVAAMQALGKRYKLVALSNIDEASVARTLEGPLAGMKFDAVYTAEKIGSYKPDPRNFEYLLENVKRQFGVEKGEVLHVAQSIFHDHQTVGKMGLKNVWVDRKAVLGGTAASSPEVTWNWTVESLGELAEMVEKEAA
ncbi:HAD-like protein, partial [Eremomyces bilateralis CBS 781.70]